MSSCPLVSVLIAVYNEERHLGQCIESLLGQSYEALEIIVGDDGSTDGSVAVARRYPSVRLIIRPHLGKAKTINAAAAEARGEILLFLDGDLFFDREYVAQLVAPIVSGREIGACHGTERVANPDNPWSRCVQRRSGFPVDVRLLLSREELADGSIIFRALRADLFRSVGGFDDTGHTDDHTLFPKLRRKAVFVESAICHHYNVETLGEVYGQGVWGGKSIHLIHGSRALLYYAFPRSILRAIRTLFRDRNFTLSVYDLVFEAGIFWGVLKRTLRLDHTYGR